MNHIVKIEYKVTAYVVVPQTDGMDDESIFTRAERVVGSVPEKDLYWELSDTEINQIGGEIKEASSWSYLTSRKRAEELLNNKTLCG